MSRENDEGGEVSTETSDGYDVGYGRPPKHSRFQPGQSGNPRGRPKGTKNLKTDLSEELREKIRVREGECSRKISKQRAVVKTIVAKAAKGDARAANLLVSMMNRLVDTGEGAPDVEDVLDEDELEILNQYVDRAARERSNPLDRDSDGGGQEGDLT